MEKKCIYFLGRRLKPGLIDMKAPHGKQLLDFNSLLNDQLKQLVYEIDEHDKVKRKEVFSIKKQNSFYWLLIPALIGLVLHALLYYPTKILTGLRFTHSGHYDSVMTSILLLAYPFYLAIFFLAVYMFQPLLAVMFLLIMPLTAWAAVQVKYQLDI